MALERSHYFRVSVTDACTLACTFCHREGQPREVRPRALLGPTDIGWACGQAALEGFSKFKLTGGEPTLRKDLCELVSAIRAEGIEDLSMISNGTMLAPLAVPLRRAGLTRINVSLQTVSPGRFEALCGGGTGQLEDVLRGIQATLDAGFPAPKLNFVWTGAESASDFDLVLGFAIQRGLTVVLLPVLGSGAAPTVTLYALHRYVKGLGVRHERMDVDREGIRRRVLTLESGATVLLRADELGTAGPWARCGTCESRSLCREGIFPVRLSCDGVLRSCLAGGVEPIDVRREILERRPAALRAAIRAAAEGQRHAA